MDNFAIVAAVAQRNSKQLLSLDIGIHPGTAGATELLAVAGAGLRGSLLACLALLQECLSSLHPYRC